MEYGSIRVKVGDWAKQGQILGLVSNTGDTTGETGYHIHFQVQNTQSGPSVAASFADIGVPVANIYYTSGNRADDDDTGPSLTITASGSPNSSGWYTTVQTITWNVYDGESGLGKMEWWWDSLAHNTVALSGTAASGSTGMLEGDHWFHIKAWDKAGNASQADRHYMLDVRAPTISVTAPQPSYPYNTPQTVKWNVADAASGLSWVEVQWDSNTPSRFYAASGSLWVPGDGHPHAFRIRACDVALNTTVWFYYGPFIVDTEAPQITYLGPQERAWSNSPEQIIWAIAGASSATLQWDSGTPAPVSMGGGDVVPEGIHAAALAAVDEAGNAAAAGGEYWIDLHAPMVVAGSLTTPPESGNLNTLSATWQFSDDVVGVNTVSGVEEYEYWIGTTPGDSDVFGPLSAAAPWAWATGLPLQEGTAYYVSVRARDAAGNWSDPVTSGGIVATVGPYDQSSLMDSGGTSVESRNCDGCRLVDALGQFAVGEVVYEMGWGEHGYWHSAREVASEVSVPDSRSLDDGAVVLLGSADWPVVVTSGTSAFAQRLYVEEGDRTSGIAVEYGPLGGPVLLEGDQVWITGQMRTVGQERVVGNARPFVLGHLERGLAPYFMVSRAVGGSSLTPLVPGVPGSIGPYNVGLLVKVSGRVTAVDPAGLFFCVDDGGGLADGTLVDGAPAKGIRVSLAGLAPGNSIAPPSKDSYVAVTGLVSLYEASGLLRAQIRPRRQADIVPIAE
jgi:hypothetical protein